MASFSNSSEGSVFDEECGRCKFGKLSCPIAMVQMNYNYDQHNDKTGTATKILNSLVNEQGECEMLKEFSEDLEIDHNQLNLFE